MRGHVGILCLTAAGLAARTMGLQGRFDEACALLDTVRGELGRDAGADGFAVDAGHVIALVSEGPEGIAWNERLIAFAETSNSPAAQEWLGSL